MSEQKYKTELDGKTTATFGGSSKGNYENPIAITDEEYDEIQTNWKAEAEAAKAEKEAYKISLLKKTGLTETEAKDLLEVIR